MRDEGLGERGISGGNARGKKNSDAGVGGEATVELRREAEVVPGHELVTAEQYHW